MSAPLDTSLVDKGKVESCYIIASESQETCRKPFKAFLQQTEKRSNFWNRQSLLQTFRAEKFYIRIENEGQ